jgi:NADPH:quinone reductase-like Zn-dependent oxidoreductase
MKAAVHHDCSPPELVQATEVQAPAPHDGEVLVRIHATTVNHTDCGFRSGSPLIARLFTGLACPQASILGNEFAGDVDAYRHIETGPKVGDVVMAVVAPVA